MWNLIGAITDSGLASGLQEIESFWSLNDLANAFDFLERRETALKKARG